MTPTEQDKELREILANLVNQVAANEQRLLNGNATREETIDSDSNATMRAEQAIKRLIKELVAEAKPAEKDQLAQSTLDDESRCRFYRYGGYNFALNEFERNLLKALEEVK